MSFPASNLPRTLALAVIVLTVCCADGGMVAWHGSLALPSGDDRAGWRAGELRQRAAASRSDRPARPEVRPTLAAPHAGHAALTVRRASMPTALPGSSERAGDDVLSFAESRLPPPAVC